MSKVRSSFVIFIVSALVGVGLSIAPAQAAPSTATTSSLGSVSFAAGSFSLSPSAKKTLASLKSKIAKTDTVTITGYIRNHENNGQTVGLARANAVKYYLVAIGVKASFTVTYGGVPKVGGSTPSANRVEISKKSAAPRPTPTPTRTSTPTPTPTPTNTSSPSTSPSASASPSDSPSASPSASASPTESASPSASPSASASASPSPSASASSSPTERPFNVTLGGPKVAFDPGQSDCYQSAVSISLASLDTSYKATASPVPVMYVPGVVMPGIPPQPGHCYYNFNINDLYETGNFTVTMKIIGPIYDYVLWIPNPNNQFANFQTSPDAANKTMTVTYTVSVPASTPRQTWDPFEDILYAYQIPVPDIAQD